MIDLASRRNGAVVVAASVAGYIAGAYFFTSSTSFANPAVTIARTLTNTYTVIAPNSAVRFVAAQPVGTILAVALCGLLAQTGQPVDGTDSVSLTDGSGSLS